MKRFAVILFIACLCVPSLQASLCEIAFSRLTTGASVDISGQLKLTVSSDGEVWDNTYSQNVNRVTFKFDNIAGGTDSVISEIYFYDGSLLNMYSIDDSYPGVEFEGINDPVNPTELSGYVASTLVSVIGATEAKNPEPKNGVKVGQWLKIGYTLLPGVTFQDLIDEIAAGEVVVGIHVKSIDDPTGGAPSDSFVTDVPEPATLAILGLGGFALAVRNKKRRVL